MKNKSARHPAYQQRHFQAPPAAIPSTLAALFAEGLALHQAGRLATDDPAYRRGVAFLLRTQEADGTWFVASRSKPFQLYFESGFPYGKDQFISMSASSWAVTALCLALPER